LGTTNSWQFEGGLSDDRGEYLGKTSKVADIEAEPFAKKVNEHLYNGVDWSAKVRRRSLKWV